MTGAATNQTKEQSQASLNDKRARAIDAPAKGYVLIADTGKNAARGLALRITTPSRAEPAGARAWVFTYRCLDGRQRRYTIGRINSWPLDAARVKARTLRQIVDEAGDPLKMRQDERDAATVHELAQRYIEEHLPRLRQKSQTGNKSLLNKWVLPKLGTLQVKEVSYTDIDRLHRQITATGKRHTANRVVSLLSKMFNLAIRWKVRTDNPVKGVERNHEERRSRYLSDDELVRLMAALAEPNRTGQPAANAVRLLLLTGARRDEVLTATWDQLDLTDGVWTKPSSHTKQKREHRVPLSAPARQLLADMWAREKTLAKEEERGLRPNVFPSRGGNGDAQRGLKSFWRGVCGAAGLAEHVKRKDKNGKLVFKKDRTPRMMWRPTVRIHDLRHTYASSLAGAGLSLPIIGALLGHTQTSTTQRYAHLADAALRAATERVGAAVVAAEKGAGGAEVHDLHFAKRA